MPGGYNGSVHDVGDEIDRRVDAEVRLDDVPFGLEEVERILLADDETGRGGDLGELHLLGERRVDAADVDDELLVDEDEDVVVAAELERLVAAVLELRVELDGEVIVVRIALVAEAVAGRRPPRRPATA
jgi:hypothetical protein